MPLGESVGESLDGRVGGQVLWLEGRGSTKVASLLGKVSVTIERLGRRRISFGWTGRSKDATTRKWDGPMEASDLFAE